MPHIRAAQAADASRLTEIAHQAKRHWGYDDALIDLWDDALTVTEGFIEEHPVYCAVRADEILGFFALTTDGQNVDLEHMWIDPEHIREGLGRVLFEHAVREASRLGGTVLRIAADPNAEGFYLAMGALRVGDEPSTPEGRSLPVLELDVRSRTVEMS